VGHTPGDTTGSLTHAANLRRSTGTLLGDYWIGLNRSSPASPWSYFNGSLAPAAISNGHPYAHWSWYHPTFALNAGYDCILAWWVAGARSLKHSASCSSSIHSCSTPAMHVPPWAHALEALAGKQHTFTTSLPLAHYKRHRGDCFSCCT
jgi:hypothetical protein